MPEGITPKRIFYFVTTMEARYRFRKISSKVYDDFLTRISRDYARVKTRDLFLGYPMPVEVFLPMGTLMGGAGLGWVLGLIRAAWMLRVKN